MKSTTYVALLRGINVGGTNSVSMADLKTLFVSLGYESVNTYINSGNVIFKSNESDQRKLEQTIEKALTTRVSVMVFSIDQIKGIVNHVPKSWLVPSKQKCNVIFLRYNLDSPNILDGLHPKPDIEELHYYPGALLWAANLDTLTRCNMIKISSNPIYKDMTVRIFNTVRKIYDIMRTVDQG